MMKRNCCVSLNKFIVDAFPMTTFLPHAYTSTRYTLICITLLNFQSRLQHTRETFRLKMGSIQEMQRVDRELSSELIESPVNPAFLHISTPLMQDCDPSFCLQVNGVALWEWRKFQSPGHIFDTLQNSLSRIGYRLSSSSRTRVGKTLRSRVDYITKKTGDPRITSQLRRRLRSEYWCQIALHPDEIVQGPEKVIGELRKREELLMKENQSLRDELEGTITLRL